MTLDGPDGHMQTFSLISSGEENLAQYSIKVSPYGHTQGPAGIVSLRR